MTATCTVDVLCTLDGFGSYDGNGDRGEQGPEFLDRRLAAYGEGQRMVLGVGSRTLDASGGRDADQEPGPSCSISGPEICSTATASGPRGPNILVAAVMVPLRTYCM